MHAYLKNKTDFIALSREISFNWKIFVSKFRQEIIASRRCKGFFFFFNANYCTKRISCHSFSRHDASTRAPFQFLRCVGRITRVATLPCVRARLSGHERSPFDHNGARRHPRVVVSHKRRKIEGRVTSVLCNLSLRVRVRPTATARRAFRTAISLSLNYSLTRVSRGTEKEKEKKRVRAKITAVNGEEQWIWINEERS